MSDHTLDVNTILHTKDGSKIGNAIVTGRYLYKWEITTDYGNKCQFTTEEIEKHFNIAWHNYSKEVHGYTCDEMQQMMREGHKYRVGGPVYSNGVTTELKDGFDINFERIKIASILMQGILSNSTMFFNFSHKDIVLRHSLSLADALIKEYKEVK